MLAYFAHYAGHACIITTEGAIDFACQFNRLKIYVASQSDILILATPFAAGVIGRNKSRLSC